MNGSDKLKKQATGILAILIIQYAFGMIVNLYIQFPQGKNEGQSWQFAWSQWPLAVHIILGIGLVIGSIALLIRAIRFKNTAWIRVAWIGVAGIFLAALGGSLFVPKQTAAYSLLMAASFLLAFAAYGWGVLRGDK